MEKIANLQTLSSYSLLKSPIKIKDLLKQARDNGYYAIALTDINVTYGLVEFFEMAKKYEIKPILGMQVRISGLIDSSRDYELIVLARNNDGFKNILRLSSAINLKTDNGTNGKILTLDKLTKYLADLVVITPANVESELRYLAEQNHDLSTKFVQKLKELLPKSSDLYLGVYASESQTAYIDHLKQLSEQFDLPLVATEDVQYLHSNDQFLKKTLAAISENSDLQDPLALSQQAGSHYLHDTKELKTRYHELDLDAALANTKQIADTCDAEVIFKEPQLPKFHQDKFATSKEYLLYLADIGLKSRFKNKKIPEIYQQRLKYELKIINQMGFDDYFLIVWDVINYAHHTGIVTGPGRGSAAGSLVAYALRITEVDPIKYNLLFERFLNPSRAQMPDIDLDIPDNRRDDVIKYMYHKYGMDHAAEILTFGTLAAKQALRDCTRVFGLTVVEANKWTQAMPYSKGKINLKEAYEESKDLQILVNATLENKLIFQTAQRLEGIPRHYSIHAAGLVISDYSIAETVGLQAGPIGIPVTQQTKTYVEALGLLKIDFLGLRNLTILGNTLALLKKEGINLNPNKIPLNDPDTLKVFQKGQTDAVFQFESPGIRKVLRALHPDSFEDIVAVNALYRPGPMQNINTFIARKLGKEPIVYPDPSLKEILQPTYGILVYQEQVMQTAQVLAGFSLGEADILRRAMSKKKQDVIDTEKSKFIEGSIKLGRPKAIAMQVYNYIEQFANYGFNRSHAVAYSIIAFWLAYLKVHYPGAFYTALLNSNIGNRTKVSDYVMQAQNANIKVLNPDINLSQQDFTLTNNQILVGFRAIKGLRVDFIKDIVSLDRPFESITAFLNSINPKFLNVDAIKSLIKAGCFDHFPENRNTLLANCKDMVENIKFTGGNLSLSESLGGIRMEPKTEPDNAEKAEMEEEVMGFSVTQTPLVAIQKYAQKFDAKTWDEFNVNENGIAVGKLMKLKQIKTKKGATMAFVTFADATSQQEVTIFPNVYEKIHNLLKEGQIYLLRIRTQSDHFGNDKIQFFLLNVKRINFKE